MKTCPNTGRTLPREPKESIPVPTASPAPSGPLAAVCGGSEAHRHGRVRWHGSRALFLVAMAAELDSYRGR